MAESYLTGFSELNEKAEIIDDENLYKEIRSATEVAIKNEK